MDGTFLSYNAVLAVAQPPTVGTAGNDTLRGTSAGEVINGLGGGDWFIAGTGNDIVHGGNGLDMITFIEAQSSGAAVGLDIFSINGAPPVGAAVGGVTLDLSDPFKGTGLAQGLTLISVERVTG